MCCSLLSYIFGSPKRDIVKEEYLQSIPFIPPITSGRVVKIYDGDTITIASRLPYRGSPLYRFSVRLSGIDCPEIKGKTEFEKTLAKKARDSLHEKIFGKIVRLKYVRSEKYGRLLAEVYLEDLHLNKWMLENNYAVPYQGGTKERPSEWDKNN